MSKFHDRVAKTRAGCRTLRRTKDGVLVGLYNAREASMDDNDGEDPWVTLCEEHGTLCNHRTRRIAEEWLSSPASWCEECRAEVDRWCSVELCSNLHDVDRPETRCHHRLASGRSDKNSREEAMAKLKSVVAERRPDLDLDALPARRW